MAVISARLPKQLDYWAVGITHFFIDFLNSGRNVIVALLAVNIGLTNAQVGLALLVYNVGNALSQPFFGLLADRIGPRWLVIGGMVWMMVFSAVAALAGDWIALIAVTAAGLGSGAFHPTGTMVASRAATTHRNQATALFFVFGQSGLFLGPVAAGWLLDSLDRPGYLFMPAICFVAIFCGWQWVHNRDWESRSVSESVPAPSESAPSEGITVWLLLFFAMLSVVIVGYSSITASITTYIPKLYADLNFGLSAAGWLSGLYMAGGVIGGLAGGTLADRIHGKWVVSGAMFGAAVSIFAAMSVTGPLQMVLLFIAGCFSGAPHTILVIAVQNNLPGRQAFASGLVLGFMFFSGSLGSYFLGWVGDQTDLLFALRALALFPLTSALVILLIPAVRIAPLRPKADLG